MILKAWIIYYVAIKYTIFLKAVLIKFSWNIKVNIGMREQRLQNETLDGVISLISPT